MAENEKTQSPPQPLRMFRNRYVIGAAIAFVALCAISFGGLYPSSELVVKSLGAVIIAGVVAWFVLKPWK